MALIRHAEAESLVRDAVPVDLGDMHARAEDLKSTARAEADRIIKEAQAERDRLLSDASQVGHEEGYAAGHAEGMAAGTKKGRDEAVVQRRDVLKTIEDGWSSTLESIEQRRAMLYEDARDDVIELAVCLAERVLARSIAADPSVVVSQLSACLDHLRRRSAVTIRIHPEDEAVTRDALPGLISAFEMCEGAEVVPDPAVDRGGAVVSTDRGGTIGGSLHAQLDEIARLLVPDRPTRDNTDAENAPREIGDAPSDPGA